MADFLSTDWLDEVARLGSELVPFAGVSGRMQLVVSGGPEKDVKLVLELDEGRVTRAERAVVADAELTLTLEYANAVAIHRGELDPSVAFMQGRLKAAGDTGMLLQLLSLTRTPTYRSFREKLAAVTDL